MYIGWVRRGTLLLKHGDAHARLMFVMQGELEVCMQSVGGLLHDEVPRL